MLFDDFSLKNLKKVALQAITNVEDDYNYGQKKVGIGIKGNLLKSVPVLFREKIQENQELLSTDLIGTLITQYAMAVNFDTYSNMANDMLLFKDMLEKRHYINKTTKGEEIIEKGTNEFAYIIGEQTYTYKKFLEYLDNVFYGEKQIKENFKVGKNYYDVNKITQKLNSYQTLLNLSLNVLGGLNNVFIGKHQLRVEAIGGQYFGVKNLAKADALFIKNLPALLVESGSNIQNSFLALWCQKFGVGERFDKEKFRQNYKDRGFFRKLFKLENLQVLMNSGEFYMNMLTSLSLANRIELLDAQGNKIKFIDAFEVKEVKKGIKDLVLRKGIKNLDGTDFTLDNIATFIMKQNGLNHNLYGIYNNKDQTDFQRRWYGSLFMLYRKYYVPMMKTRFGTKYYNPLLGDYTEGFYNTIGRVLLNCFKYRRLSMITQYLKGLSIYERANIRKGSYELIKASIMALIISFLFDDDDDDETYVGKSAEYLFRRLNSEIQQGLPVLGLYRSIDNVIKQSIAASDIAAKITNLFDWNFSEFDDEIERGRWEGYTKWQRNVLQLVPVYNNVMNVIDPSDQLRYYKVFKD